MSFLQALVGRPFVSAGRHINGLRLRVTVQQPLRLIFGEHGKQQHGEHETKSKRKRP